MTLYRVRWDIDIDADSPREAAEKAMAVQRSPHSIATVFDVWPEDAPMIANSPVDFETIDLLAPA